MNPALIVVDTSVFFSLLVSRDTERRRRFLSEAGFAFYCPRFVFVELFKHKERIVQAAALNAVDLLDIFHELLTRVHFVEEGAIPIGPWMEARRLCRDVDPKDAPFVALTLHLQGRLWTSDEALMAGLRAKSFERFFES